MFVVIVAPIDVPNWKRSGDGIGISRLHGSIRGRERGVYIFKPPVTYTRLSKYEWLELASPALGNDIEWRFL